MRPQVFKLHSVSWNMKSSGNRSRFRRTASFRRFLGTSYNAAKSLSSMTLQPRKILRSISSTGTIWTAALRHTFQVFPGGKNPQLEVTNCDLKILRPAGQIIFDKNPRLLAEHAFRLLDKLAGRFAIFEKTVLYRRVVFLQNPGQLQDAVQTRGYGKTYRVGHCRFGKGRA